MKTKRRIIRYVSLVAIIIFGILSFLCSLFPSVSWIKRLCESCSLFSLATSLIDFFNSLIDFRSKNKECFDSNIMESISYASNVKERAVELKKQLVELHKDGGVYEKHKKSIKRIEKKVEKSVDKINSAQYDKKGKKKPIVLTKQLLEVVPRLFEVVLIFGAIVSVLHMINCPILQLFYSDGIAFIPLAFFCACYWVRTIDINEWGKAFIKKENRDAEKCDKLCAIAQKMIDTYSKESREMQENECAQQGI